MTYNMAVKILDRVREGIYYPERIVTQALILTGDLDPDGPEATRVRSERLEASVLRSYKAVGTIEGSGLVERDHPED